MIDLTKQSCPPPKLSLAVQNLKEIEQQPDNSHHDRAQITIRATLPAASSFPWLCMAFEMAFLALLVTTYIRRHYPTASRVMEHVGVFFCAVALLLAIWMTLNPPLKQMSVVLFFIGFTIIILANRSLCDWCVNFLLPIV